jgi:hypothetical protein
VSRRETEDDPLSCHAYGPAPATDWRALVANQQDITRRRMACERALYAYDRGVAVDTINAEILGAYLASSHWAMADCLFYHRGPDAEWRSSGDPPKNIRAQVQRHAREFHAGVLPAWMVEP